MPTYQIKAPNGKTYRIDGPEGASDEQVQQAVLAQFPDASGEARASAVDDALLSGAPREQILEVARQNNLSLNEADLDANLAARSAGSPTSGVLPPRDAMTDIETGLKSSAAGTAQGVAGLVDFPMSLGNLLNRGINQVVGAGGSALLDLFGADRVAEKWRQDTDRLDARLAETPLIGDMIERASPTPENMKGSRFASQLLGGLIVPFGPKAPFKPKPLLPTGQAGKSAAQEVVDAGVEHGVRVMTSDVKPPKTFIGKTAQAVGERIPFAGTGGPRAAQQAERVEAVKKIAEEFGSEVGGDYLEDVAKDLARTRGTRLAKLTGEKERIITGVQGGMQSPRAIAAIDQQIARLAGINREAFAPVIAKLEQFKQVLQRSLTLEQVEGNRKLIGDLFADQNLASIRGDGQKAINAIYAPLRDDMAAHIRSTAGDEAASTWKRTNDELAAMAGELTASTFKRVLADSESTPENVARLLFSQKPSDVRRLMANVSPQGRARAQAAIIERALSKAQTLDGAGQSFSPDKFANEIARLGKQSGVVFEGTDLALLKGLERLLQATKRASTASAAPPTGVQNTPIVGGYAAGTVLGSAAIPYAALLGMASRAYESAPVRNLLLGLFRTKPGSVAESRTLERLGKVLISQGEIQSSTLSRAANENFTPALAAQEDDQN